MTENTDTDKLMLWLITDKWMIFCQNKYKIKIQTNTSSFKCYKWIQAKNTVMYSMKNRYLEIC